MDALSCPHSAGDMGRTPKSRANKRGASRLACAPAAPRPRQLPGRLCPKAYCCTVHHNPTSFAALLDAHTHAAPLNRCLSPWLDFCFQRAFTLSTDRSTQNSKSLRRLAADHGSLHTAGLPPNYLFAPESDGSEDLTSLDVLLAGPVGTPYSGGVWRLHLDIPSTLR